MGNRRGAAVVCLVLLCSALLLLIVRALLPSDGPDLASLNLQARDLPSSYVRAPQLPAALTAIGAHWSVPDSSGTGPIQSAFVEYDNRQRGADGTLSSALDRFENSADCTRSYTKQVASFFRYPSYQPITLAVHLGDRYSILRGTGPIVPTIEILFCRGPFQASLEVSGLSTTTAIAVAQRIDARLQHTKYHDTSVQVLPGQQTPTREPPL